MNGALSALGAKSRFGTRAAAVSEIVAIADGIAANTARRSIMRGGHEMFLPPQLFQILWVIARVECVEELQRIRP